MPTDKEIRAIQSAHPTENDPMPFARAIESALLSKLAAGVSVEPSHQYLCTKCGSATPVEGTEHYDNPDCSCGYSMFKQPVRFTLDQLNTAIAAARVQENERCAKAAEVYMILHYGFDYGVMAEIRALIGKETP